METSSPRKKEAVIAGAGLVGALWAVFLAQRGYAVKVFERRPDMRAAGYQGGRSINLAMSVRGWKAIEQAGLRPNPTLDVTLENFLGTGKLQGTRQLETTVQTNQIIERGGKREKRIALAGRGHDTATKEFAVRRSEVIASFRLCRAVASKRS